MHHATVRPRRRATVLVVVGTRPEAIKLAPVVHALRDAPDLEVRVAATAQHREMLDQVLDLFGIVPDVDLDVIQPRQSLTDVTTRALAGLAPVLDSLAPDVLVVQGDTTTTLAGALAGFYARVPVVHLEAGLRTGDPWSPYPEETNRRLVTRLASLHLAATTGNRDNLRREGVAAASIAVTGNTVIDALLWTAANGLDRPDPLVDRIGSDHRRVLLVTAHRRESWGDGMAEITSALATLAERPDVVIVFPVHRNPAVRDTVVPALAGRQNVHLVEPLAYSPFVRLMNRSDLILTDSGGIQEEGPSLGKPVLVLRDTTERPEAVAAGTARLIGPRHQAIVDAATELLDDPVAYAAMAGAVNPYGDGHAAVRTVAAIRAFLGLGRRLPDFAPVGITGNLVTSGGAAR